MDALLTSRRTMSLPVVFRPQAERELLNAEQWYEEVPASDSGFALRSTSLSRA